MSYAMQRRGMGIAAQELRERAVQRADPAVRAMAQGWIDEGNTAFRAGDNDTAIRRYTDAFLVYPHPNVLLLIGVVMMRQGRYREASYRFSRYLRENPDGDRREMAQEQLANAQAAMERERSGAVDMDFVAEGYEPAAPGETAPVPPPPAEVPPAVMEQARRTIQTPQQAAQRAPAPTTIGNPYREAATYGIWIGTGVAIVGLGFIGWYLLRSRKPKVTANRRRRRTSRRR